MMTSSEIFFKVNSSRRQDGKSEIAILIVVNWSIGNA